jgi:hypothetical protein
VPLVPAVVMLEALKLYCTALKHVILTLRRRYWSLLIKRTGGWTC